jgi:hypothetical protein
METATDGGDYLIQACHRFHRPCGSVFRVPGYRPRVPRFDSRLYQIFQEVVGMERDPLGLVRIIEKLLQ